MDGSRFKSSTTAKNPWQSSMEEGFHARGHFVRLEAFGEILGCGPICIKPAPVTSEVDIKRIYKGKTRLKFLTFKT
jgi:hypothetical protein